MRALACLGASLRGALLLALAGGPLTARAAEIRLEVGGDGKALEQALQANSALIAAGEAGDPPADVLFAAALADYRRLSETLHAEARYGGVVHIRLDGREAAEIPLLSPPDSIREVVIRVDPGPLFSFGTARLAPLPEGATPPDAFRTGAPARAAAVRGAVEAGIDAWRAGGHAEARLADSSLIADHRQRQLDAMLRLAPGKRLRFGPLVVPESAVRETRVREIAGLPGGARFSPDALGRTVERLRRTGAFSSVTAEERPAADGAVPIALTLVDAKPRRIGFGAEVASSDGVSLSGFWLHRNLLGGAERLRFDAEAENLASQTSGEDGRVAARFERPATFDPDTDFFANGEATLTDEDDYISRTILFGAGLKRRVTPTLDIEYGAEFSFTHASGTFGPRDLTILGFPALLTRDRRDDPLDATEGYYLQAGAMPFLGLSDAQSGARLTLDGRAYRTLAPRLVAAARLRAGSVVGPDLDAVPPEHLFSSGGGGTVRGQPFESLDVDIGGGREIGGRSFLGLQSEMRAGVSERIGLVAFVDAAYVGPDSTFDGGGEWHSGGGIGLRYATGLGPIRLDLAGPISGGEPDGLQFYLGIGQAF